MRCRIDQLLSSISEVPKLGIKSRGTSLGTIDFGSGHDRTCRKRNVGEGLSIWFRKVACMSNLFACLWIVLGVVVAVVLPVLWAYIGKMFPKATFIQRPANMWPWMKKYLLLLLFSGIVALASFAIWRNTNPSGQLSWFTAFLLGFGWESALEKFLRPNPKAASQPQQVLAAQKAA